MNKAVEREVRLRASDLCEYCRMPRAFAQRPFQVDHIIAEQHGGQTELGNLALACFVCNIHKGPNIAGMDPESRRLTRLFNPRKDRWARHFIWDGARLAGKTAVGRATIEVLAINDALSVAIRERLIAARLFPTDPMP